MNNFNIPSKKGFTLIELLVAIAIFAILSALGWKIFDYLIKVKDRNAIHEENLGQLQEAYAQIQRDALQIIPLTANISGQIQPALKLENQNFSFNKAGVSDPLKRAISPYERIEYQYNGQEKKLYRLKYANINLAQNAQPVSSVLLSDVDQFQITVLNPNELTQWPNSNTVSNDPNSLKMLPKGFRIRLSVRDVEYEWIYSVLNTHFLEQKNSNTNNGQIPPPPANTNSNQQKN